ncbi:RNA-binding S4 domain-containing protein [Cupriavidus pauculus]|uniref:RNA-binding protein n=1 Tax=Cupriavidus pauculus TaxID=82633 RepID=A0A2N5CHI1_9BURK|nr:RNA-binding S4 domain-containing protein [Cupriavidus pauculus]PLQ01635.1 RNA-binding protein [Cupriavidus pauculus]
MAQTITFPLEGEFIALNDLLKVAGVCDSGGAGKALVAAGEVSVDGATESRKTAKIRAGQVIAVGGADGVRIKVVAA